MIRALTFAIATLASVSAFVAPSTTTRSNALSMAVEGMSASIPFLKKPKNLDGLAVS